MLKSCTQGWRVSQTGTGEHFSKQGWLTSDFNWRRGEGGGEETLLLVSYFYEKKKKMGGGGG